MDDTWEDYDARDIARTVAQILLEKSSAPSVDEYVENYTKALEGITETTRTNKGVQQEIPSWITVLDNYFTDESKIDHIREFTPTGERDPLNIEKFVQLEIKFTRNQHRGKVVDIEDETVVLKPAGGEDGRPSGTDN